MDQYSKEKTGLEVEDILLLARKNTSEYQNFFNPRLLPGETIIKSNIMKDNFYFLTQYRIGYVILNKFNIISLGSVHSVEVVMPKNLLLLCKDGKCLLMLFSDFEYAHDWEQTINASITNMETNSLEIFAFKYYNFFKNKIIFDKSNGTLVKEFDRLNFGANGVWLLKEINQGYELCDTYPIVHILPSSLKDKNIVSESSKFRSKGRFPSVTWRNRENYAVLIRSSQPKIGLLKNRCTADEFLIETYINACVEEKKRPEKLNIVFFDARSNTAALANMTLGGGYENTSCYENSDIKFGNLNNIHRISSLFYDLAKRYYTKNAISTDESQSFDNYGCEHLKELSAILCAGRKIAKLLSLGHSVMVHCSDGWDRTPTLCSLAKLMIDPFYRTLEGFMCLIQLEWIEYGHKFKSRCVSKKNINFSPVFIYFLDCVHQIVIQSPNKFEYNDYFLLKIIDHTYSNLYGNFLEDSAKCRKKNKLDTTTNSLWDFILTNKEHFINLDYDLLAQNSMVKLILPHSSPTFLVLWDELFNIKNFVLDIRSKEHQIPNQKTKEEYVSQSLKESLNDNEENNFILFVEPISKKIDTSSGEVSKPSEISTEEYDIIESSTFSKTMPNDFIDDLRLERFINDGNFPFDLEISSLMILEDGFPTYNSPLLIIIKNMTVLFKEKGLNIYSSAYQEESKPTTYSAMMNIFTTGQWDNVIEKDACYTKWVADNSSIECYCCKYQFYLLRRRHHCRRCGHLFCSRCSNKFAPVPEEGYLKPVRVCNFCHQMIALLYPISS